MARPDPRACAERRGRHRDAARSDRPRSCWRGGAGFEASFPGVLVALAPHRCSRCCRARATAGAREQSCAPSIAAGGHRARDFALAVVPLRHARPSAGRRGASPALLRALGAPLRDLHTGDAQEYLLFLVGVAVLALLLPLLR